MNFGILSLFKFENRWWEWGEWPPTGSFRYNIQRGCSLLEFNACRAKCGRRGIRGYKPPPYGVTRVRYTQTLNPTGTMTTACIPDARRAVGGRVSLGPITTKGVSYPTGLYNGDETGVRFM